MQDNHLHPELFLEPHLTAELIEKVKGEEIVRAYTEIYASDPEATEWS